MKLFVDCWAMQCLELLFEKYQRLTGVGRLPPFYNNLVTQRGICGMNRENPTYVL